MVGLGRLMWNIRKWIDSHLRINIFGHDGENIVSYCGRRKEHIPSDQIAKWQVFPEMGFDVVQIVLRDGSVIHWHDKYNDLLSILREVAKEKQVE
jgi:hypothetical protein